VSDVEEQVDDLQAAVDRLAADGFGLVDGIGQYEHIWRMAYVCGPDGIIVSRAERTADAAVDAGSAGTSVAGMPLLFQR
jgi:hypothetical protein